MGLYHKLLEELIKDDIINEISKWIEKEFNYKEGVWKYFNYFLHPLSKKFK